MTQVTTPPHRPVQSMQPATGEIWREFPAATPDDIRSAVARARAAQPAWAALPLGARLAVVRRFHDIVYARRAEIAGTISRETNKPRGEALAAEVAVVLDDANFLVRVAPKVLWSRWANAVALPYRRKRYRVVHEPIGVVAAISPWNYPWMLACSRLLPLLVAGNAVIFKPSELTPSTGDLLVALLHEAGVPADVLAIVQGDGAVGAAMTAAPVDKVCFTGSENAGRAVATACAQQLIPCSLELGGSDAAIVCEDANVAHAASGLAWGRFANAGQTCVAPKRVIVAGAAYEPFVAAITRIVARLRAGDGEQPGTDVGAMIRPQFRAVLEAQRDDALARGAKIAATAPSTGAAFAPTVLIDVPADSRAIREETFGPLMVVTRVADDAEAIHVANDSVFGLSASVWSRDQARAARIAGALDCGSVAINDVIFTAGMSELPHGGVKRSGYGKVHGVEGLLECVRTKGIVADRLPNARQGWWFGYSPAHEEGVDAFLTLAHDRSVLRRIAALPRVLRLLFRPERPV